ncbi:MAG: (Fe-S)-binding protein [Fimbriimonadaceae bacterium]
MKELGDLTAQCIRCGFCLEACPTFKLTGSELESPRGRIYLARSAEEGVVTWAEAKPHFDRCLGCLACEPACPSAVQYGEILELARSRVERDAPSAAKALLVEAVTDPLVVRLSRAAPMAKMPTVIGRVFGADSLEANLPRAEPNRLPAMDEELPPIVGEVYLLEGCAMRVLFPRVHACTRRLLRRVGYAVRDVEAGCCGSMYAHNGFLDEASDRAEALVAAMPDDLPVIVDSAGCGSTMKRYDALIDGGAKFATRVKDAAEFLQAQGLGAVITLSTGLDGLSLTYHEACHLAHGQGITEAPRALLASIPGLDMRDLAESDMCCGSAGIYNVTQPKMARELLDRKVANVSNTGVDIVAVGNPGCHAWMAQGARQSGARFVVRHTMEVLEAAFIGPDSFV